MLKTDLFDEAVGPGLYSFLKSRSSLLAGIDVSLLTLSAASSHCKNLETACADVRRLPFVDQAFDVIISNSTLDHFNTLDEIRVSLRELRRVLKPGGHLLLTMDNLANPLVGFRNLLPFSLLNRLRIVPYYVGTSCGPRRLSRILHQMELEVLDVEAVMHAPRVIAVALASILARYATPKTQQQFLRWLMAFERLSSWPTRFLTGYYVAIKVRKPLSSGCSTIVRSPSLGSSQD
jgi:SAM-dependent methyltransferase